LEGAGKQQEDPRVRLAGERTLLAWIRTGLGMMGFGFVVARFGLFLRELAAADRQAPPPPTAGESLLIGTGLVLLGVAVNVIAAAQHAEFLRRLSRGEPYQPPGWSLGIVVSLLLAAVGIGMTAYLLFLRG
jgi:putative membrane protein